MTKLSCCMRQKNLPTAVSHLFIKGTHIHTDSTVTTCLSWYALFDSIYLLVFDVSLETERLIKHGGISNIRTLLPPSAGAQQQNRTTSRSALLLQFHQVVASFSDLSGTTPGQEDKHNVVPYVQKFRWFNRVCAHCQPCIAVCHTAIVLFQSSANRHYLQGNCSTGIGFRDSARTFASYTDQPQLLLPGTCRQDEACFWGYKGSVCSTARQ